jgi:predicted alpha-1,2-mannosidase
MIGLLVLQLHFAAYSQETTNDLASQVNPLIGTKNMGHTFPGATVPFGMVQLSPETGNEPMFIDGKYNKEVYRYCSGYQYDDSTIFGFSHTHFSGTGHSDLGDFLVMPTTGRLILEPGENNESGSGYFSMFSHDNETAMPGYYQVGLSTYGINAELTSTKRVGFHQYTFPKNDSAHILLDFMANIYNYDDKNVWTFVRVENDTLITGYRQTSGWARTRTLYFAMVFSKPVKSYGHKKYDNLPYKGFWRKFDETENFPEMAGRKIRAYFNFKTEEGEKIKIKFALSAVSTEGALKNLQAEIPGWDFDQIKDQAREKWNNQLRKIAVKTQTSEQKESFYTALYHTMLSPVVFEDVDGSYRGLDDNVHPSNGFTNYTIFSLWDTYRALHPLFNLIEPSRNADMINSMLAHYDQSVHHMLPVWSHYANENWCMIGYHAVSVLADAAAKGNTSFDLQHALEAAKSTSQVAYFDGIGDYMKFGYVPEDKNGSSVSKTLEYAYDDWCIAQLASFSGDSLTASAYLKRSDNYNHVYNRKSRFMQPRLSDGTWKTPFDPLQTHDQGFIEGNAWNYGLYVPQQVDSLVSMKGGKTAFSAHLDSLFTMHLDDSYFEETEDITRDGIIGNYVHGNEPGHHIAYLYNWTNDPWKTQSRVRMIMETMYGAAPDGLCGNDDAGQMSAWYVFSALGFYPVCPGSPEYALGSPIVEEAIVHLENGKNLHIIVRNQSLKNIYVKKVLLDGIELKAPTINHFDLIKGGELEFVMSSKQGKK